MLAIIVTLEHFTHLIEGLPITVQTDHRNLKWLMAMKDPQGRLGRWVLRLQRHRFDVEYRAGKANEVADALSRHRKLRRRMASRLVISTQWIPMALEATHSGRKWTKELRLCFTERRTRLHI